MQIFDEAENDEISVRAGRKTPDRIFIDENLDFKSRATLGGCVARPLPRGRTVNIDN
ncbi:MAG TPA: hypothetical protein VIQ24_04645 [Pyrinomonadaceae bacterium]